MRFLLLALTLIFIGCSKPVPVSQNHISIDINVPEKPKPQQYKVYRLDNGDYLLKKQDALILKYNWMQYKTYTHTLRQQLLNTKEVINKFNKE